MITDWSAFIKQDACEKLHFPPLWEQWSPITPMGKERKAKLKPYLPHEKKLWQDEMDAVIELMPLAKDQPNALKILKEIEDIRPMVNRWNQGIAPQRVDWYNLIRFLAAGKKLIALPGFEKCLSFFPRDAAVKWDRMLEILIPGNGGALHEIRFQFEAHFPEIFQPLLKRLQDLESRRIQYRQKRKIQAEQELGFSLGLSSPFYIPAQDAMRIEALEKHPDFVKLRQTPFEAVFDFVESEEEMSFFSEKEELNRAYDEAEQRASEQLSKMLSPYIDDLLLWIDALGLFDFIYAKACFAASFNGVKPVWDETSQQIVLQEGFHPWLKQQWAKEEKDFTPVDLELRIMEPAVIAGPNMGGKSVAIKTLGLCMLLAQLGFPVPAKSFHFTPVEGIWWIGGDREDAVAGLSSFGGEIKQLTVFWNECQNRRVLVLCDEVGRGTNPEEGEALAVAIVEAFLKQNWFSCFVTHYSAPLRLRNIRIYQIRGLDLDSLDQTNTDDWQKRMDHRLIRSDCSKVPASALEIATWMGLPKSIADRARKHYTRNQSSISDQHGD